MRWLDSLDTFIPPPEGTVVTWGVFDGVHLGHRELLRATVDLGRRLQAAPGVLPFRGHPDRVLWGRSVPSLTTEAQRRRELGRLNGLQWAVALLFDEPFSRIPAERFVDEVLVRKLKARGVVVGPDTTFGAGGRGDIGTLRRMGDSLSLEVVQASPVVVRGVTASSSEIRGRLACGDVGGARELLGRPYALEGTVVPGDRRGRAIGFPTANLDTIQLLPARGVYAGRADVNGRTYAAVLNVGERPTFGGGRVVAEAHLIDCAGDLYGRTLEVAVEQRLRDEQRFEGPEALAAQIRMDVERARELFT